MASEIRVNKLENRVGLGTVECTNTGIVVSGIVTATSFEGSGANLTGVLKNILEDSSPQLGADLDTNGFGILVDDNKVVNFGNNNDLMIYHSGTHSYIKNKTNNLYIMSTNTEYGIEVHGDGKVRLNYDNSPKIETTNTGAVVTGIITATSRVSLGNNTTNAVDLEFGTNRGSAGDTLANINWKWNNTYVAQIRGMAGSDTTNKDDAHLNFYTASAGSLVERLRIFNDGRVQIAGQNAIAATSLTHRLLVRSQNTSDAIAIVGRNGDHIGELSFYQSDASTKIGDIEGHSTHLSIVSRVGYMSFATGGTSEKVRIDTNGRLLIGKTSGDHILDINASNSEIRLSKASESNYTGIQLDKDASGNAGGYIGLAGNAGHYSNTSAQHDIIIRSESNLLFSTSGATERLRIESGGNATFTTNQVKLYNATDNSNTYFYTQNTGGGNAGVRMKNQDGDWTIIANDSLRFRDEEASADRLNITSGGHLVTGAATAPNQAANDGSVFLKNDATLGFLSEGGSLTFNAYYNGGWKYYTSGDAHILWGSGDGINLSMAGAGTANNTVSFSRAFQVTTTKAFHFGSQTSLGKYGDNVQGCSWYDEKNSWQQGQNGSIGWSMWYLNKIGGTDNRLIQFNSSGSNIGYIVRSGSNVAYQTSSDYRLKKDVVALPNGIDRVKQLRPVAFKWIADDSDMEGFLAHEAQEICPYAVSGTKDEVATEDHGDRKKGDMIVQAIDYGEFTPLLTAAMKELIAKVETLEAEVAALKG